MTREWQRSGPGKAVGEGGWGETESEMSKAGEVESSISERPGHHRPRRLADWIDPAGARKVTNDSFHSHSENCVFVKAVCGKLHARFERRTEASARAIERASSGPTGQSIGRRPERSPQGGKGEDE